MTYLSNDLSSLCIKWCPVMETCPEGHYCIMMDRIRKEIIKISEFGDYVKNP